MNKLKFFKKNRFWAVSLCFLAGLFLFKNKKPVQKAEIQPSSIQVVTKQFDDSIMSAIASFEEEGVKESPVKSDSYGLFKKFEKAGKAYSQLKGSIHKRELRDKILSKLVQDPKNIQAAQRSLTDLDWTLKTFPESQAEVRIMSIALLKKQAELGNDENLEKQIQFLSKKLSESKKNWVKGRDQDLIDLLGAWLTLKGPEVVMENPKKFLEWTHYSPALRRPFDDALRLYVPARQSDEQLKNLRNSLFDEPVMHD